MASIFPSSLLSYCNFSSKSSSSVFPSFSNQISIRVSPIFTYYGVRTCQLPAVGAVSPSYFISKTSKSEFSVFNSHGFVSIENKNVVKKFGGDFSCFARGAADSDTEIQSSSPSTNMECIGTGSDVECLISSETEETFKEIVIKDESLVNTLLDWALLISPFFFWGTAMVAMKEVLPKTGPFFVSSFRLIPAGLLLVSFAGFRGRSFPSGSMAWLSISLFALVDATCFQGFLAEGLVRTSAGLGSVIIDSQPLTVAVLAALFFNESIGLIGSSGLVLGVIGLLLLEVPALSLKEGDFSLWGSGEWWMLLAAQSMAIGTVMVRWVSKYSDPIMATGWHLVIGGIPLAAMSVLNHEPVFNGNLAQLTSSDAIALLYTSVFGSAISYGVYFYNATRGSLTRLSSLTFLTPMFASIFGFFYLGETFSNVQFLGAFITIVAIYMVNYKEDEKST